MTLAHVSCWPGRLTLQSVLQGVIHLTSIEDIRRIDAKAAAEEQALGLELQGLLGRVNKNLLKQTFTQGVRAQLKQLSRLLDIRQWHNLTHLGTCMGTSRNPSGAGRVSKTTVDPPGVLPTRGTTTLLVLKGSLL
jgi:hypothetical protein